MCVDAKTVNCFFSDLAGVNEYSVVCLVYGRGEIHTTVCASVEGRLKFVFRWLSDVLGAERFCGNLPRVVPRPSLVLPAAPLSN